MTAAPQDDAPVVIIGAGLAGLTVALHLADSVPVVVIAKRELNEAATAWAQGGIVGVLGSDDSIDTHVEDRLFKRPFPSSGHPEHDTRRV